MFCLDVIVNSGIFKEFKYKEEIYPNDKNLLEFLNLEGKFGWEYVSQRYLSNGDFVVTYRRQTLR
jgi:hypothetical protein